MPTLRHTDEPYQADPRLRRHLAMEAAARLWRTPVTVTVDRKQFADALTRAAACTGKMGGIADKLRIGSDGNALTVVGTDFTVGAAGDGGEQL